MESFKAFIKRLKTKIPSVNIKVIDWKTDEWEQELPSCQIIANCTPNGMGGRGDLGIIFPYESVCENAVFFDAIYEPMQTEFCLNAEKRGFLTVSGIDLLVHQGICSFNNWTGIKVESDQMKEDIMEFLNIKE